ncbi:Acyl-coa-binding domain-containing protein [Thalictrum thalictroides]|uniref:Acyl-coa-binding domain-containing protein n=1 Tax=Thalictrum thalictroides TaxID=46969 RepID=A0A7J6URX7_THATH|nr:Acyl-coa-binding domain-containing protein [Thalictrum thalictroides]
MTDWQELGQSILIGLIFSFLLSKLISILFKFKDENFKLVRGEDNNLLLPVESTSDDEEEEVELIDEKKNGSSSSSCDWEDDDDLSEAFYATSIFIASSTGVSNEVLLKLYGFYKIATDGPCNTPQPSALQLAKHTKWHAWQRLGAMSPEEAMQNYITIVTELYPFWATGSTSKNKDDGTSSAAKRPMGPVFSSFAHEESDTKVELHDIHASSRDGEIDNLLKFIDSGISINLKDSEGRTPLHWAVDRGNLKAVELLVSKKADLNVMDDEGQTPLHYATMCEREATAEYLVIHGADTVLKDNDGNSPCDLCKLNWPWMQNSSPS